MLDCERFSHHRANTAGTGKSREDHQQMAEQWEQQFHSERNSNRLGAISNSPLRHPVLQDQEFATHSLRDWMKVLASEPNQVGSPHNKAYHLCVAAGIQVLGLINFGAFFSSARGSGTKKVAESKTISAIGRCVSHI
jgi:hypothetical protein